MKHTIEKQFEDEKNRNLSVGDVIIFNKIIKGKNFPRVTLYKFFNKLVSKEDYTRDEKDDVFQHTLFLNSSSV